jgi:hypothetical protein
MFIVTLEHQGNTFWLRGTVWAYARERASEHETEAAALAALAKAKPFMKATQYRNARVESA